jgi:hypothetical protein
MDGTLLQIIAAQHERLSALEDKIDAMTAEKAEDNALLAQLVHVLSALESRTEEALAGLRAIQLRNTAKVGGTDWSPKL